jgi:hypothetical protein
MRTVAFSCLGYKRPISNMLDLNPIPFVQKPCASFVSNGFLVWKTEPCDQYDPVRPSRRCAREITLQNLWTENHNTDANKTILCICTQVIRLATTIKNVSESTGFYGYSSPVSLLCFALRTTQRRRTTPACSAVSTDRATVGDTRLPRGAP